MAPSAPAPLAAALWPADVRPAARAVSLVAVGVALLTVSANVSLPAWPVPITLQTFVVYCLAAIYGGRLGMAAVAVYLALGATGLPVFAGTPERGIGLSYMTGPTGGYLAGFAVAALAVGVLADRGWMRRPFTTGIAMTTGSLIVLGFGWLRLADLVGADAALANGVVPFVPAEALKVTLATLLLPLGWRLAGRT